MNMATNVSLCVQILVVLGTLGNSTKQYESGNIFYGAIGTDDGVISQI